jgi:hypothetical protein
MRLATPNPNKRREPNLRRTRPILASLTVLKGCPGIRSLKNRARFKFPVCSQERCLHVAPGDHEGLLGSETARGRRALFIVRLLPREAS